MISLKLDTLDGYTIPVSFFPVDNPKGLVQLIHGSLEHKGRYYDFIQYLNSKGYACIISDNRGHGENLSDDYPKGHHDNTAEIIDDLLIVTKYIKEKYPSKPLILFGHSLGSQFARVYIEKHDDNLKGLILSGTVNYKKFAFIGKPMANLVAFFKRSDKKRSNFLFKMSGLSLSKDKWLSYNKENIEKMDADQLNSPSFTIGGYRVLFDSNNEIKKLKHYECKNPSLQILTINGQDDPITGFKKGVKDSVKKLRKIGYKNIEVKIYPNMMHEILNEKDHQIVYDDVVSFLDRVVSK